MPGGVDGRTAGLHRALDGLRDRRDLLSELEPVAGDAADVQQIVDQAHHQRGLPLHDAPRRDQCRVGRLRAFEDLEAVAQRGERIAQLVRKNRQELIFALVRGPQHLLGELALGDVEIESREPDRLAFIVVVVAPVCTHPRHICLTAHNAVLDREIRPAADGALERLAHQLPIVRMNA